MCTSTQPTATASQHENGADLDQPSQAQRILDLETEVADQNETIEAQKQELKDWEGNALAGELREALAEARKLRGVVQVFERALIAGVVLYGVRWILNGDRW